MTKTERISKLEAEVAELRSAVSLLTIRVQLLESRGVVYGPVAPQFKDHLPLPWTVTCHDATQ